MMNFRVVTEKVLFFSAFFIILSLNGCGQMGPLYLENNNNIESLEIIKNDQSKNYSN